jgi:type II secretory pathway pseudopilin PulG
MHPRPLTVEMGQRSRPSRVDGESGETLIELLITIAIVGVSAVALLGALVTAVAGSTQHRSLAVQDSLLKSYAEAAKQQIELQASPLYQPCAGSYPAITFSYAPYAPYTAQITSIEYWNGSNFASSCQGGNDGGLQEITISAQQPPGGANQQQLSFVVRNPSYAHP